MARIKLPHMPLWVYDLEADEDCALMSLSEYGAYMKLLQRQWIEGSIPVDPTRIARLLRVPLAEWEQLAPAVMTKFVDAGRGRRINRRLDEERIAVIRKIEALTENGKMGGRPKNQKVKQKETKRKPKGSIRASGSDSGSYSSSPDDELLGFEEFWSLYPSKRKYGKSSCSKKWRAKKLAAIHEKVLSGLKTWIRSDEWREEDGKFVPAPEVWLNQERWEAAPSQPSLIDGFAPVRPTTAELEKLEAES